MNPGPVSDVLAAIVAAARRRVEDEQAVMPLERVRAAACAMPPARSLRRALQAPDGLRVIAECKRRSPSRGILRRQYDVGTLARAYELAGAAAISVLTEPAFFDGALAHLESARAVAAVPVLRKDFIVDRYQIWQARAAGADAVLLIVAALDDAELLALLGEAQRAGLEALVEVHDEEELGRAAAAGADLVGVNNRDLRTLAVDVDTSRRLAGRLPPQVVAVAESGLHSGAVLRELQDVGYRGFLIGERFMTADDPAAALRALLADADSPAAETGGRSVPAAQAGGEPPCA